MKTAVGSYSGVTSGTKTGNLSALALAAVVFTALSASACGAKKAVTDKKEGSEPAARGACECLTTPNGVPRKVIVKTSDAKAYKSFEFTGESQPLKFFRKYFVYREQSGKGYLVGDAMTRDSTIGWVHQEDVIPWNHEEAMFFINKGGGRVPVKLWTDRREVGKPDAPYFQEDLSASETSEPFPILQREGSMVKIAFLWGKEGSKAALSVAGLDGGTTGRMEKGESVTRVSAGGELHNGGDKALKRIQSGLNRLDIALVIDVTSSMGPYMDVVKQRMTQIVDELSGLSQSFRVEPHIAVVAYRDYADARNTFTTKRLDFTQDRSRFSEFMSGLQPFSIGADKYEAVFEGLGDAVDRLDWGANSYKLMFLVGDAPPQGFTPQAVAEPGVQSDSPYFTGTFAINAATIQRKIADSKIRFYALQVGDDPETADAWRQILGPGGNGNFRSLADAGRFISQLEKELRIETGRHAEAGQTAFGAISAVAQGSGRALSNNQAEVLSESFNMSPRQLEELRTSRIQTGWFDVDSAKDRVSVCVYLRRRDLDALMISLRQQMQEGGLNAQELEALKTILAPYLGQDALRDVRSINDLMNRVQTLPLPPEVVREIAGKYDNKQVTENLRTKMNNIGILSLQRDLFNQNEEGWVPIEYLPGSMSKEH